jgi:hypothetical protein
VENVVDPVLVKAAARQVAEYHGLLADHRRMEEGLRQELVRRPKTLLPFLQPGRLLRCLDPSGQDWGAHKDPPTSRPDAHHAQPDDTLNL